MGNPAVVSDEKLASGQKCSQVRQREIANDLDSPRELSFQVTERLSISLAADHHDPSFFSE
jgi:hypothetical protein